MQYLMKLFDWLMSGEQQEEATWRCFFQRVTWFMLRLIAIGFLYWLLLNVTGDIGTIIRAFPPAFIMTMR